MSDCLLELEQLRFLCQALSASCIQNTMHLLITLPRVRSGQEQQRHPSLTLFYERISIENIHCKNVRRIMKHIKNTWDATKKHPLALQCFSKPCGKNAGCVSGTCLNFMCFSRVARFYSVVYKNLAVFQKGSLRAGAKRRFEHRLSECRSVSCLTYRLYTDSRVA